MLNNISNAKPRMVVTHCFVSLRSSVSIVVLKLLSIAHIDNVFRDDLPSSCAYGNRIDSCDGVTLEQCGDPNTNIGTDCCESCFDLLVS